MEITTERAECKTSKVSLWGIITNATEVGVSCGSISFVMLLPVPFFLYFIIFHAVQKKPLFPSENSTLRSPGEGGSMRKKIPVNKIKLRMKHRFQTKSPLCNKFGSVCSVFRPNSHH